MVNTVATITIEGTIDTVGREYTVWPRAQSYFAFGLIIPQAATTVIITSVE